MVSFNQAALNFHVSSELKVEVESKMFLALSVFLSFSTEKWLPTHFWIACVLLSAFQKDDQIVKVPCYCQVLLLLACTLLGHKKILHDLFFLRRENTACYAPERKLCWMYRQPNVSKDVNLSFYTALVNRLNFRLWFLWPHLKQTKKKLLEN